MTYPSYPEQRGGMEDVGTDDLGRPQREREQECQPEEDTAADRRQANDEAAEEADPEGDQATRRSRSARRKASS